MIYLIKKIDTGSKPGVKDKYIITKIKNYDYRKI